MRPRSCGSASSPGSTDAPGERTRILKRLDALAVRQLELVDRRSAELERLREEIRARRARIAELLDESGR